MNEGVNPKVGKTLLLQKELFNHKHMNEYDPFAINPSQIVLTWEMWCSQLGKTIQPSDVLFNLATHFQRVLTKSDSFLFFNTLDISLLTLFILDDSLQNF